MFKRVLIKNSMNTAMCTQLYQMPKFSVHTPMIKFIGRRHQLNKHLGINDNWEVADTSAQAAAPVGDVKAMSPNAIAFYDNDHHLYDGRGPMEEAEMECVNMGSNEITVDWTKITL